VCPSCEHRYDPDEFFGRKRQLTKKLTKEKRQLTNADKLRSMSDAELAEFLMFVEHRFSEFDRITWLGWLQQEVDT
jgi:hypothetical protein